MRRDNMARLGLVALFLASLTSSLKARPAVPPEPPNPLILALKPITDTGANHPARNPSFTLLNVKGSQQLLLWWRYANTGEANFNIPSIPMGNARWQGTEFVMPGSKSQLVGNLTVATQITSNLYGPQEQATLHLYSIPGESTIAACLMSDSERRQSFDAKISTVGIADDTANPIRFEAQASERADIPFALTGFLTPKTLSKPHYWVLVPLPPDYSYRYLHPTLLMSSPTHWFLVGTSDSEMWFTRSEDAGVTWKPRVALTGGNRPILILNSKKQLLLTYIDSSILSYPGTGIWPGDNMFQGQDDWPCTGHLMQRRSSDNGATWGAPQVVVNDKLAIESRACVDAAGRIWLVYVQSDPATSTQGRASLWLTSSGDDGQTWIPPVRLTDGQYLDREPDIIVYNGKLLVAFARGFRALNTNIWVAEVDPKAALAAPAATLAPTTDNKPTK